MQFSSVVRRCQCQDTVRKWNVNNFFLRSKKNIYINPEIVSKSTTFRIARIFLIKTSLIAMKCLYLKNKISFNHPSPRNQKGYSQAMSLNLVWIYSSFNIKMHHLRESYQNITRISSGSFSDGPFSFIVLRNIQSFCCHVILMHING